MALPKKHESQPYGHLTPENSERLAAILHVQINEVFRLSRLIERKTGYVSRIGQHNLNDALAHLAVLADPELEAVGQASQLSKIEEHLRRVIVEHPEEVVRDRLGNVWDLWQEYERECYPYRETGDLRGAPRHEELEELRKRIGVHLESARRRKPNESSWDEAIDAAADATQAADLAVELANKLDQCIGTAKKLQRDEEREAQQATRDAAKATRDTHRFRINAGIAVVSILVGLGGGYAVAVLTKDPKPKPKPTVRTVTQSAPATPSGGSGTTAKPTGRSP